MLQGLQAQVLAEHTDIRLDPFYALLLDALNLGNSNARLVRKVGASIEQ